MATRIPFAGTSINGVGLSDTNLNDYPGGLMGYEEATSTQGSITGEVALSGLTMTFTPSASRILAIEYSIQFTSTVANDEYQVKVYKDGSLFDVCTFNVSSVNNIGTASRKTLDLSPTSASHTYLLKAQRAAASTGTFTMGGSATNPAWFMITDVGVYFT